MCHALIPDTGTEIGSGNRQICAVCHEGGQSGSIRKIRKRQTDEGVRCLECHGGFGPLVGASEVVCRICHSSHIGGP